MEHTQYGERRKTEPTLDGDPAGMADLQPPYPELPAAAPTEAEAAPAPSDEGYGWLATLKFWSIGLCAVALLFLATMWVFDEHGSSRAVPARMPVAAATLPLPPRGGEVPPLVLLPSAPVASKSAVAAPAAVVALAPPAPVPGKAEKPALPKPPVARPPVKALVAKAVPKAPAPRKPALAVKMPVQPKAKPMLAAVKKPAPALKRSPPPVPVQAKPKMLASAAPTPAPAPREEARAAPATSKKCLPGELARACAARQ